MTTPAADAAVEQVGASVASGIIDCDVHNATRSRAVLRRYLPGRFARLYDQGTTTPGHAGQTMGARPSPGIYRLDSRPAEGPPGSSLELMIEQLLDPFDVRRAVLHPVMEVLGAPTAGPLSGAIMTALNDWMVDEWLDADARVYGGISVSVEDGARAATEITRAAEHPKFVNVVLPIGTREGLGHAKYWPIHEAAADLGLPIVCHVGGFSGTQTACGWQTYFVEGHTSWTGLFQAQAVSLIESGVFERFPDLQIVLEEGGVAWMPSLMWRLDRLWESMGEDVHDTNRLPSELVREHFWFTTQPFDEPERPGDVVTLLDHLGMDDRIMFASDYPHWDFDDPTRVLTSKAIGAERRERIFRGNAEAVFGFDRGEPGS
jgi:predicted TIM-barrel fold metal-dependent hydrolase